MAAMRAQWKTLIRTLEIVIFQSSSINQNKPLYGWMDSAWMDKWTDGRLDEWKGTHELIN